MTTFDEREKAYEKKFAIDQEKQFKAAARRNKLLGEWAAGKLGLSGGAVADYVNAVVKADLPVAARQVQGTVYSKLGSVSPKDLTGDLRDGLAKTGPNKALHLTASSVRSSLASAFGSR